MSAIELMAKLGANPSMRDSLSDMEIEKLYALETELASNQMGSYQSEYSPDDGDEEEPSFNPN